MYKVITNLKPKSQSSQSSGMSRGVLRVLQHPPEAQRPIY